MFFLERGPVNELLLDNGAAFRSTRMTDLCNKWNIARRYRAAYRPAGNGIVERHHRTVKRMAERSGKAPTEMVFWYNLAPKVPNDPGSSPSRGLYNYVWRHPMVEVRLPEIDDEKWQVGEEVLVKPPGARCTTHWKRGRVTGVTSSNNIDVDGTPRHVLDIRRLFTEDSEDELDEQIDREEEIAGRPARQVRRPRWMDEYIT